MPSAEINLQTVKGIHTELELSAMEGRSRVLIVGGTGYIGRRLVKASLALGHPTFVLARPETFCDIDKVHILLSFKQQGAKLVEASLDDREGLVDVLKQVDVVISAVAGTHLRYEILQQLKLIEAIAEAGNIKRFLPSEFGTDPDRMEQAMPPGHTIFHDKRTVRRAIEAAGIPYTYVSANLFASYLGIGLAQPDRLMPPRDRVRVYGDGDVKAVWVDDDDVGTYTLKTIDDPRTLNKTLYIRPPRNILSHKELVEKWEEVTGRTLHKTYISEEEFLRGFEDKPYLEQMTISHFYHFFFRGDLYNFEIGPNGREATELYPEVEYTTMDSFWKRYI